MESNIPLWFKRRINKDSLKSYIDKSIQWYPTPCDDFDDDDQYSDSIIEYAVDELIGEYSYDDDNIEETELYNDLVDLLNPIFFKFFDKELKELYNEICSE